MNGDMEDSVVDRVLLWMVSGLSGNDLVNACIAKLEVDPAQVKGVIDEARKRLTVAADYNRDELLGTALTRLNDLYARCIRQVADGNPNLGKALDVQREINRLVGLYRQPSLPPSGGSEGGGETSDELAAVAEHLLPLGLADEHLPLREHARLAAQRIREGFLSTTPTTISTTQETPK
jgi:hypothetical protein